MKIFIIALFFFGAGILFVRLVEKIKKSKRESAENQNFALSEWEENLMAHHEAGHAMVILELFGSEYLSNVTIDPNNDAFGFTRALFNKNFNDTYPDLIKRISVILAGRFSEKILLGEITTSGIHDFEQASFLTFEMVTKFGMGKNIGCLQLKDDKMPFISENLKSAIEKDVFLIMDEAVKQAEQVITKNKLCIEKLAKELKKQKTISVEEILKTLGQEEENKKHNAIH